jgi:ectoine hydroxylase-related dioxygenase (phytanoyl-CoA dioxygenase family)
MSVSLVGYAVLPGLFSKDEVEALVANLPALNSTAGTRTLLQHEWCRKLAGDPRIREAVEPVLGPKARPVRGILFDKSPSSNWNRGWHQDTKIAVRKRIDTPGFSSWSEKEGTIHCLPPREILEQCLAVRIHLDPCGLDNGPLRVVANSHLSGMSTDVPEGEIDTLTAELGDVVLMRPLLWHASSKSEAPDNRRVIHIEYSSADLPNGLEWAEF